MLCLFAMFDEAQCIIWTDGFKHYKTYDGTLSFYEAMNEDVSTQTYKINTKLDDKEIRVEPVLL